MYIWEAWARRDAAVIGRICDLARFKYGLNYGQFEEVIAAALGRPVAEVRPQLDNLLYYTDMMD